MLSPLLYLISFSNLFFLFWHLFSLFCFSNLFYHSIQPTHFSACLANTRTRARRSGRNRRPPPTGAQVWSEPSRVPEPEPELELTPWWMPSSTISCRSSRVSLGRAWRRERRWRRWKKEKRKKREKKRKLARTRGRRAWMQHRMSITIGTL